MSRHLTASPAFRRLALALALVLAVAEIGIFILAWRLGALVEPGSDPRAVRVFVLLGTMLTIQAMVVIGVAWSVVALSRTELEWGEHVRLEHPWRRWSGDRTAIRSAWWRNGWLAFEVRGQWRRWYVRVADPGPDDVAAFRAALGPGVWLEGRALRAHYLKRVLPMLLGAAGVGGLLLVAALTYLRSW